MLAGYETTSVALTYCIYLLSKHPAAQQQLLEEVDQFEGKPSYEDLGKFPYTAGVLNEAMRLLPPAPLFARIAQEDVQVQPLTGTYPQAPSPNALMPRCPATCQPLAAQSSTPQTTNSTSACMPLHTE